MKAALGMTLALVSPASGLAAQAPDSITPLTLVRCAPRIDVPCLQARVPLDGRGLALLSQLDSAGEAHAWTGDLAGRMLIGPAVTTPHDVTPPLRLLILLDRSGSMIGDGIAYTRITLRSFIQGLDSGSVRVAITGFESHDVNRLITETQFVSPAQAAEQLARLPTPDPRANTALYSALIAGGARVAAEIRAAPGTQGAILLVTDGRNDVGHPRDDAGLLAGANGLRAAASALSGGGQRVWIMGVGKDIAADTLRMLVGSNGSVTLASLDPNVMAMRLAAVSRELRRSRELIFAMPAGTEATLARTAWRGIAAAWVGDQQVTARALSWQPPLFAMPAYRGVAAASALTPALRDALGAGSGGAGVRWVMALFLALSGGAAWLLIPRLVWMRTADVTAPVADLPDVPGPKQPAKAEVEVQPDGSGLRRDVEEVAPRKPSDVTLQSVRRVAAPKRR
jgi:hypothetical protein